MIEIDFLVECTIRAPTVYRLHNLKEELSPLIWFYRQTFVFSVIIEIYDFTRTWICFWNMKTHYRTQNAGNYLTRYKKFNVCPPPQFFFIQFYTYHFLILVFANELFHHSDFAFILSCKMTEKTNQASILFFLLNWQNCMFGISVSEWDLT